MHHPLDRPITAQQKRVIDRAQRVRGLFVGSYSQVEYLLGNLWLAVENISPYFTRPSDFPWKTEKRIKNARLLFDVEDGPLFQFRDRAVPLFEEMTHHQLKRHIMAHGYIDITTDVKESSLTIRCFRPTDDNPANEILEVISLNRMEADAKKAAEFTSRWLRLFFDIHKFFGWVAPATVVVSQNGHGVISQRRKKT